MFPASRAWAPSRSYLTINISSPNTPGLRDLQAPDVLDALLARVKAARRAAERSPPLLVKLAPDIADAALPEMIQMIQAHAVDGIVVSNTTLARDGLTDRSFARETGGLSGRPLFARSTRMLARVFRFTEGKLPLIGVGGIRFRCDRARQDRGRRLAAPALYWARVRRTRADRPHQAGADRDDGAGQARQPHAADRTPCRGLGGTAAFVTEGTEPKLRGCANWRRARRFGFRAPPI